MAASPLSVVLKGGRPNLGCERLCTKAVKWVEWGKYIGQESEREASARFGYREWSVGQPRVIAKWSLHILYKTQHLTQQHFICLTVSKINIIHRGHIMKAAHFNHQPTCKRFRG